MNSTDWIRESNLIEGIDDPLQDLQSVQAWVEFSHGPLTMFTILRLHRAITLGELVPNNSGYWRDCNVAVGGRTTPHWTLVPTKINEWFQMFCFHGAKTEGEITEAHIQFEKIHPFVDGNGRTGRMIMNWQRQAIGLEPLLIKASERQKYYEWFK